MPAEDIEREFGELVELARERRRTEELEGLKSKVAELERALEEARKQVSTPDPEAGLKLRSAETAAEQAVERAVRLGERLARAMAQLGAEAITPAVSDEEFETALATAAERIARVGAELEVHRHLLHEQTALRAQLEAKLQGLTDQLQTVGGAVNLTNQEVERERTARAEAESALASARDAQKRTDAMLQSLQQELAGARTHHKSAEGRAAQLEAQLGGVSEKFRSAAAAFEAERAARGKIESELAEVQKRRAALEAAATETQALSLRLDGQIRKQLQEVATLRDDVNKVTLERDGLSMEVQRYQMDLQRTTGQLLEAQSEQQRLEMLSGAQATKAKKLADELSALQVLSEGVTRERDRLLSRVAEQQGEIDKASEIAERSRAAAERTSYEFDDKKRQFEEAHRALEMLAQQLSDANAARGKLEEEALSLTKKNDALVAEIRKLGNALSIAEEKAAEGGARLATETVAFEQERAALKGTLAETESERARIAEALKVRQEEIETLGSEVTRLRERSSRAEAHVEHLTGELEARARELQGAKTEVARLEGEAAALDAERDRIRKDLANREETIKDFESKRERIKEEWERTLKAEREARQAAQESLRLQADRAQQAERIAGELEARTRQERGARQEAERLTEAAKARELQMVTQRMELEAAVVEAQAAARLADSELEPIRERERELKSALGVLERRVEKERELREEAQLALEVYRIREVEWGAEREALEKKIRRLPQAPELPKSEAEAKFQKDRATLARHLRLVHEARLKLSQSLHASENLERELASRINELERNLEYERETKALLARSEEDARRSKLAAEQERDRSRLAQTEASAEAESLRGQLTELNEELTRAKGNIEQEKKKREEVERGVHIPGVITPQRENPESPSSTPRPERRPGSKPSA